MSKTVMVVDDEVMITSTLSTLIKMSLGCKIMTYNNPVEALEDSALMDQKVDLIISDFIMPEMDGLSFLKEAKNKSPKSVRILLTGYADKENAIKSINEVGLYYYLEKPWDNSSLIKIIQNGIENKYIKDELERKYIELEDSNQEIKRLYDLLKNDYNEQADGVKNLVVTLANVIEAKDKYTDGHTRRVADVSRIIGEKLGIEKAKLDAIEIAGIIHDIGKVYVPENILNKNGKLTSEEFEIVKKHTIVGENICKPLNCLNNCIGPVRHHHEKLDGSGYPDGLKGDEISIEDRIICVADIFDALYSDRPYRAKLPIDEVKDILKKEVELGKLDGKIVEILFAEIDQGRILELY